ncbi:MAG: hypothetical protein BroJett040_23800 [Oligoflexia bacterium]|nr:MAG: hypothetical protein BroJett040_23800 [Oligoflexia bacterium]
MVPGKSTHVVFKSTQARGKLSFYTHKILIHQTIQKLSKKYLVQVQDYVNMGNHLHLKVRFKNPDHFKNFIRVFGALISRQITGARKGRPFGKFWDSLVYTRVLHSSLEELQLKGYFEGNHRERELGYSERLVYLKNWNAFIQKLKHVKAVTRQESELILNLPSG